MNIPQYLLDFIPAEVARSIILPFTEMSYRDIYDNRQLSSEMYKRYVKLSNVEVGEWASTPQPWLLAIENDDDYLMSKILRAFHTKRIVIDEYVGEEEVEFLGVNGEEYRMESVYQEVIVNSIAKLEEYVHISIDEIISLCVQYKAEKIFDIISYDDIFMSGIIWRINHEDSNIISEIVSLSIDNYDILSYLLQNVADATMLTQSILNHSGSYVIVDVLNYMIDKEGGLSIPTIDEITSQLESIDDEQRDEAISILQDYPYIVESY
jgi:hypothetical protein